MVGERAVVLAIDSGGADVSLIYGWVSVDRGRSWKAIGHSTQTRPPVFRYDAPEAGQYDFYFVLENQAGRSGQSPEPGARPHATIVVDVAAPIVQLHAIAREPDLPRTWRLRASILDDNLGSAGIRVFYRARAADLWRDGGPAAYAGGALLWSAPEDLPERFDLRVLATDRAGHRGFDDLTGVLVPLRELHATPTSQPTAELAAATELKAGSVALHGAKPTMQPASQPTAAPAAPDAGAKQLRELAEFFRERGQFELAAARLESALERAPDDAQLLIELGGALSSSQRWDEARKRYESALQLLPESPAALEGLALVAAQQRRYPDARDLLQRLLTQRDDSAALWMRLGDVQYRLGEQTLAAQAWNKAAALPGADDDTRRRAAERARQFGPRGNRRP